MSDDLVKQLEKAMEQSEQREAQLNDRISALEDILYLTEAKLESAEQQGYASAMEAERKLHEARIEELEAKLAKAVGALEFYADADNYEDQHKPESCGCCYYLHDAEIKEDEGAKARTALAELKGQDDE